LLLLSNMPATNSVVAILLPELEELEELEDCCGANVDTKAASTIGFETKNCRF